MRTSLDVVNWQSPAKLVMHRVNYLNIYKPVSNIRLISHDDDQQSGFFKLAHRGDRPRQQPKIFDAARRVRLALTHFRAIDHAIAVEKNRAALIVASKIRHVCTGTLPVKDYGLLTRSQ